MPDYSKAKIYRVFCEDDQYIGSTIRPLSERMYRHRTAFKTGNTKHSTSYYIFEKHGIENVKIELIEEYPCENKEQLLKREGEIQRERNCVNRCIAGRTCSQYHQDNRERDNQLYRQWREDNPERYKELQRQWRLKNHDKLAEYKRKARQSKTSIN